MNSFRYYILLLLGTCLPLAAPENGVIECEFGEDGFATKRDFCTFTCNDGFELHGSAVRKCWVWWGRSRWTGYEAACKEGMKLFVKCIMY